LQSKKNYGAWSSNSLTHTMNEVLVKELGARGVDVFGLSPGIVASEAYNAWGGFMGNVFNFLASTFGRSIDAYAEVTVHLIATEELTGKGGKYFDNNRNEQKLSKWLGEGDNSKELYAKSLALLSATLPDKKVEK